MIGRQRRYADLTTVEAARVGVEDPIAVIPAGAIEPHGPHLPLATDLLVAEHVAARAVAAAVQTLPGVEDVEYGAGYVDPTVKTLTAVRAAGTAPQPVNDGHMSSAERDSAAEAYDAALRRWRG